MLALPQLRDERAPHSVWTAALHALLPLSAGGGGGGRDGCVSESRLADALAARVFMLERQPMGEAHDEVSRPRSPLSPRAFPPSAFSPQPQPLRRRSRS